MSVSINLDRLRHWTLHRQCLSPDSQGLDTLEIIDRIIALHATDPLSPFLSLLARNHGFEALELEGLLEKSRQLAKVRFVRKTVHVLPVAMLPVAFSALRSLLVPRAQLWLKHLGLSSRDYQRLCRRVLDLLENRGKTAQEIKREIGSDAPVSAVLNLMCDQGRLIRGLPRKGWKSNLHIYFAWEACFPDLDPFALSERESRALIVRRYIEVFGPVTQKDVKWWTGFPASQVSRILENIKHDLVECKVTELRSIFWMFRSQVETLQEHRWTEEPVVSLLPLLDPLLMGYKLRERLVSSDFLPYVIDRSGNATSVVLVDGKVAGVWDYKVTSSGEIKLHWFKKPGQEVFHKTKTLAQAAGFFLSGQSVRIRICPSMRPLALRTAGGFMSPLKEES